MANGEITISIDKSIHDALREYANELGDMHGIYIQSVRFSWVDLSTTNARLMIVSDVEADTLSKNT